MAAKPQAHSYALLFEARRMLFNYFDWVATFLWAISGALLGARRGYDVVGIFVVAVVSAAGGGLLRDGLFIQNGPPALLRSSMLLPLITMGTILVVMFGRWLKAFDKLNPAMDVIDALGLGAYAVYGMSVAEKAQLPTMGVIMVGMVNAVAGSVLRDVLMRNPRRLLEPGQWQGSAALTGCLVFVGFDHVNVSPVIAGWTTIILIFALRLAALRLDLRSKPLRAFADDWGDNAPD